MKNNILIKILCLTFALVMAVSALGACNSDKTSSDPVSSSSSTVSDPSEEITSSEDSTSSETETASDDNADDDWSGYDDLAEYDEDAYSDDYYTAKLNIYNKTAVQEDFYGFGGVYHAFPYRSDNYGRQYTEKMAEAEIQRAINSGITMARTTYSIDNAWDSQTKSWNWESEIMQAMYKFCLGLKEGGVEVLVNHWYCNNFLFTTYPWADDGEKVTKPGVQNDCHEAIAVKGDQQATLENFAAFMSETVKQFRAHGCTNVTTISIATEPYATWNENMADIVSNEEIKEAAAKDMAWAHNTLNACLKKDGIRNIIDIMGPNFSGVEDAALYYKYFKKYVDSDSCDLISLHKYHGSDLTADNYDLWKDCAEIYKTEVGSFENFVWDEYNCSPSSENSIAYRHNSFNGTQLALAQVCFMNYGMKSSFIWSLLDQQWPNNASTNLDSFRDGVHMCGTAPTFLQSSIVFPPYYSFSLVANALGDKGSKVYRGDDDTYEGVYAAMTENKDGDISIIVVSTNISETHFELDFEKSLGGVTLYRHVYNPNNITCTAEAELINPDLKLTNAKMSLKDVIKPYCVAVYTTKKLCKN